MKALCIRHGGNCERLKEKLKEKFDFIFCQKMGKSSNYILPKEMQDIAVKIKDKDIKELFVYNLSAKECEKLGGFLKIKVQPLDIKPKNSSSKTTALFLLLRRLVQDGRLSVKKDLSWLSSKLGKNITNASFLNYLKELERVLNDERFSGFELVKIHRLEKGEIELTFASKINYLSDVFKDIEDVEKLSEYFMYMDDKLMMWLDSVTKSKVKSLKSKIIYKQRPFEELGEIKDAFFMFEEAIENRKIISTIEKEDGVIHKNVIPLKLVFMENNWYLAGVDKNKVKFFRLNFIYDYEIGAKTFEKKDLKKEYFEFLEEFETPFTKFGAKWKKLVLKVHKEKKHYFEKKAHFPREKDKKTDNEGNLIIECAYTQPLEVLPVIKKWLPFVEVVESEDGSVEKELKKTSY